MASKEIYFSIIFVIVFDITSTSYSTGPSEIRKSYNDGIYPDIGYLPKKEEQGKTNGGIRNRHFSQASSFSHPEHIKAWPRTRLNVGEISGVAVHFESPVIFHRGNHVFNEKSFNGSNYYCHIEDGPIAEDTILVLNISNGQVIRSWGNNRFYLPHGLAIDSHGNTWVTDVALHQVMKFSMDSCDPVLVLGEAFIPGCDRFHFCKPTDVAVALNGEFYIADGYCNSRILKYSSTAVLIKEWGQTTGENIFAIPHSITLIEEQDLLCTADRENERIICFSAGLYRETFAGKLICQVSTEQLGKAYGIAYSGNGLLYGVVNGGDAGAPSGFTIDIDSGTIIDTWTPHEEFAIPHDIAISLNGTSLYVSDIGPNQLFKFELT